MSKLSEGLGNQGVGQQRPRDENKSVYEVMQDKTIVNETMYMCGEAIELTEDEVDNHRERGVSLRGPLDRDEARKLKKHDGKTMSERVQEQQRTNEAMRARGPRAANIDPEPDEIVA